MLFSGCEYINDLLGLGGPADLIIKSIEPLKGDTGELTGVRLVVANISGDDVTAVKYAVVLSADETISIA
ncbi:MAG: hypothetical protein J7K04_06900 [Spirochaetales bacterium]|nr:hypothetical protein [Spirochaetales bacterium]